MLLLTHLVLVVLITSSYVRLNNDLACHCFIFTFSYMLFVCCVSGVCKTP